MANLKRTCRVCGKQYTFCRTLMPTDGTFRWQDVACSPECGAKYLEQVLGNGKAKSEERKAPKKTKAVHQEKPVEIVETSEPDTFVGGVEVEVAEHIEA